jgi:hypothetical protein
LLDTHALPWWLAGKRALSPTARTAIADESNAAFVSAATAWEITTRFRLGKLPCVSAIAADLGAVLDAQRNHPAIDIIYSRPAKRRIARTATRSVRSHADRASHARRHGARAACSRARLTKMGGFRAFPVRSTSDGSAPTSVVAGRLAVTRMQTFA